MTKGRRKPQAFLPKARIGAIAQINGVKYRLGSDGRAHRVISREEKSIKEFYGEETFRDGW